MTTIERINNIFELSGFNDWDAAAKASEPTAADTPLFYDAKHTDSDAHRATGGAGLDSLDAVEIQMALEEEFHIDIPDDVFRQPGCNTIAGIAAWIDTHMEGQNV